MVTADREKFIYKYALIIKDKANNKIQSKKYSASQKKIIINYKQVFNRQKTLIQFTITKLQMNPKLQKLISDFNNITHHNNEENINVSKYLKLKSSQLQNSNDGFSKIDLKQQLIEAYSTLKKADAAKIKIITVCQQLVAQYQKTIKSKDLQLQILNNQINLLKSSFQQQKSESQKTKKEYEKSIKQQIIKFNNSLQKLEEKQYQIRQLEDKINQYEQQLEEIKSLEYQKMLDTIKQEQIMNSQTQNLFKQNSLLKYQLKQQIIIKNQLSKHIKTLNQQLQSLSSKYQQLKTFKYQKRNSLDSCKNKRNKSQSTKKQVSIQKHQQNTINLIEYKDDFSFKDSIENDNNSVIMYNNIPSFLELESGNEYYCNQSEGNEGSPQRCLEQRDILNLTQRDRSTHSRNLTKHLVRSKKQYNNDKQNISDNTLSLNEFQNHYHNQSTNKLSNLGQKKNKRQINQLTSKCSIDQKYVPSPKYCGTQQRILDKHRRIKSSFCGKSIQQFQQYQHQLINSQKLQQSICEQANNIQNESSIKDYDVNQITINEQLITSKKPKNNFCVNMIKSIDMGQSNYGSNSQSVDIYYAFFSLTAQCVKLNSKNFNKVISIYFNLEQQYKNVVNKTIPINKWYNYIKDQIEMGLKYSN